MKEIYLFLRAAKPLETRKKQHCFPEAIVSGRFLHFLLREKTRVQLKRGSLRWFVLFGSGLTINQEEAVKKSSPGKC